MKNIIIFLALFIYQVKTLSEKFYNFDYVFVTAYYDLKLQSGKKADTYLNWFEIEL